MREILNEATKQIVDSRVMEILGRDDSGHGFDHVSRVHDMAMRFTDELTESVDVGLVSLAAQLHDVDDYKLVGKEQSELQVNAVEIMTNAGIDDATQAAVKGIIANMGYSKALKGIRPLTIEGRLVSDADMCDAIGASGVIRALTYAMSSKGSGVIFNRNQWPKVDIIAEQYNASGTSHDNDSFINHFFEKLLKLKDMMMTEPGRREAIVRDEQMVDYLRSYFREEEAAEWSEFLERYIAER